MSEDTTSQNGEFEPSPELDEATSQEIIFTPEITEQRALATDGARPIEERLEAFDDIAESEVGDTAFSRARNLEREVGFRQLYLKFEGGNPTGTQKDRIAFAQSADALRRGFDSVTAASCGNYGVAIALATSMAGLKCIIYIPERYHTKRIQEMIKLGAEIERVPGDYENALLMSRERALKDEIYDANPGGPNTALQLKAYGEIAYEIYDDLRDAPAAIAIPVSNGTTLAGIYRGFLSLRRRGKTSRMPHFIAGSAFKKNPIVTAFLKNEPYCGDLLPERIRESAVNEPLINWHSVDGEHALEAIRKTTGWAAYSTDKAMLGLSRTIREFEGLYVLPASTASLAAMVDFHRKIPFTDDRYVAVITGRKQ